MTFRLMHDTQPIEPDHIDLLPAILTDLDTAIMVILDPQALRLYTRLRGLPPEELACFLGILVGHDPGQVKTALEMATGRPA